MKEENNAAHKESSVVVLSRSRRDTADGDLIREAKKVPRGKGNGRRLLLMEKRSASVLNRREGTGQGKKKAPLNSIFHLGGLDALGRRRKKYLKGGGERYILEISAKE